MIKEMANKEIVRLTDKVVVTATEKDKYHKKGEKYSVHPKHVDYLQEQGLIELKKAKAE